MTSDSASRVTRSSRSLRLALLLFGGVLACVTVLRAQETPQPPPAAAPAPKAPAPAATEDTAQTDAPPRQANPPASTASSPAHFEPTEKVRADFDVSFPIDI
jgi:uncharacterized membrane protein